MDRLRPHRLLVLRRLQRGDVGVRGLDPRGGAVVPGRARDRGDGVPARQRGHQPERGDGGAVPRAVPRAGEGRVGVLGELWYGCHRHRYRYHHRGWEGGRDG